MDISKNLLILSAVAFLALSTAAQVPADKASADAASSAGTSAKADATKTDPNKADATKVGVVCPLSVGTAFNAKLMQGLDAHRNKSGDKFTAETTETVRYGRSVIFPRGTVIEGHVVRKSVSTHGTDRAALFLQFDKAILKNGQEAVMNAGIQALAVGPPATPAEAASAASEDSEAEAPARADASGGHPTQLDANLNSDGSTKNVLAVSHPPEDPHMIRPPAVELPLTQGAFTKSGQLTPDSKGALGAPDIRLYTPLSAGSDGTVMMSTKKNVVLPRGTRILIVIQPPRVADPAAN